MAQKSFVLIFVGRLSREKGIFDLINAFFVLNNSYLKNELRAEHKRFT